MLMGLKSSQLSAYGLSDESNSSSNWGFSTNMMMLPLMLTLFEKLLQLETQLQLSAQKVENSQNSDQLHINQFEAEKAVGGDGVNANCGPASLVIALHALGLKVKGEEATTSNSQAVELARMVMATDSGRDGVDQNGLRSDEEHNTFTNFNDLIQGAQQSGAKAAMIIPNANTIQAALQKGAKVIVSGTFVGKDPLPWSGDSGNDVNSAPGFATQHIVAITAYNSANNTFTINDPARKSPLQVDAKTLEYFMEGNRGALALTK